MSLNPCAALVGPKALATFMELRHRIYLKRLSGQPAPWSDDWVLNKYRFCNIFRELDTVTIWIRKNIREPFAQHPHLWFMLAIARYINRPETLAELIATPGAWPSHPDFTPAAMTQVLVSRAERGLPVYTGAYMIRAESCPDREWYSWSKHRYICEIVLGRLWEERAQIEATLAADGVSLQSVWSLVVDNAYFIGWGGFMTYEWVTDLRHTRYLSHAADIVTWANAGPGAIRGLNRVFERDLKQGLRPSESCREMKLLMDWLNDPRNNLWPIEFARLEMRDIEHSLCEFDKYQRVLSGEGRPRSCYDPMTAQPLEME